MVRPLIELTCAGKRDSRVAGLVVPTDGPWVEGNPPHEALLSGHDNRPSVEDSVLEAEPRVARDGVHRVGDHVLSEGGEYLQLQLDLLPLRR